MKRRPVAATLVAIVVLAIAPALVVADAATVQVDECRISAFTGAGIAQNANADVSVVDTFDDSGIGVMIAGGRTSLDRARIRNVAGAGGAVSQGTHATTIASRNVVSGMGGFGFLQQVIGVGPSALLQSARDNVLEGNASGPTSGTVIAATYF